MTSSAYAEPAESLYTSYFVKDCEPAFQNINSDLEWVGFIGPVSTGKKGQTVGGFTSEIQSGPTLGDVILDILFGSGYREFNDVQSTWTLPGGTLIEDHNAVLIRSQELPVCGDPVATVLAVTGEGVLVGDQSTGKYRGVEGDTRLYCKIEVSPVSAFFRTCSFLFRLDLPPK